MSLDQIYGKEGCRTIHRRWTNHLATVKWATNRQSQKTDRIRKRVIETFKSFGFKIEIMTNLPVVDFLDATFDIRTNTYQSYRK